MKYPDVRESYRKRNGAGSIRREEREYSLMTCLFGGGVEPAHADPVSTVRATEVRGQLRFWWRATRGGVYGGSLLRMREAEAAIWGTAGAGNAKARQSRVFVEVLEAKTGKAIEPFDKRGKTMAGFDSLQYVAFPLQPTEQEKKSPQGAPSRPVREGVSFKLRLAFPDDLRADVEAAVWAWEVFGGLGGRTRRGFGSLRRMATGIQTGDPSEWLRRELENHIPAESTWPDGVPHLSRQLRLAAIKPGDPGNVWERLVGALREFRQGSGRQSPGWPEPNSLRRLRNRSAKGAPRPGENAFPRAAFGMPIIFHFKESGDPPDCELLPDFDEVPDEQQPKRWASPLILKPVAWGNKAFGLACLLDGPRPADRLARLAKFDDRNLRTRLRPDEASLVDPLGGEVDVLEAFIKRIETIK